MFEAILHYTLPSLAFTLLVSFLVRPSAKIRVTFALCMTVIVSAVAFKNAYTVAADFASKFQAVDQSTAVYAGLNVVPVVLALGFVILAVMLPSWAAAYCAPDVFSRSKSANKSSST